MSKTLSLQSILRQRQREAFVGRVDEIEIFSRNLTLPFDDMRRRFVFSVSGQAGVGKSYLLRQYASLVAKGGGSHAIVDDSSEDPVGLMARLVEQLASAGLQFKEFTERHRLGSVPSSGGSSVATDP